MFCFLFFVFLFFVLSRRGGTKGAKKEKKPKKKSLPALAVLFSQLTLENNVAKKKATTNNKRNHTLELKTITHCRIPLFVAHIHITTSILLQHTKEWMSIRRA